MSENVPKAEGRLLSPEALERTKLEWDKLTEPSSHKGKQFGGRHISWNEFLAKAQDAKTAAIKDAEWKRKCINHGIESYHNGLDEGKLEAQKRVEKIFKRLDPHLQNMAGVYSPPEMWLSMSKRDYEVFKESCLDRWLEVEE